MHRAKKQIDEQLRKTYTNTSRHLSFLAPKKGLGNFFTVSEPFYIYVYALSVITQNQSSLFRIYIISDAKQSFVAYPSRL